MNISYQLNSSELNIEFIRILKKLFKNKTINIFISDAQNNDDFEYLSKIPNVIDSIKDGIDEKIGECKSLEDIGWR